MKFNKWTVALAATGVVSLASVMQADESHPVNTALSSTTLSGYVDTSAVWNFGTGTKVANRFVNTDSSRQDGFNLNSVKLQLEKPIDEGTWTAGYKVETMFGPDANALPGVLSANGGVAIKQAYAALRAPVGNGIDFKIGQFDPIVGYEVTDSSANPNFSRSFGFNNLEPFGHTGILASYQVNEIIAVTAGVANGDSSLGGLQGGGLTAGSSRGAFAESSKVYMGALSVKAPESAGWLSGSTLFVGVVNGDRTGNKNDPTLLYTGVTLATPIEALSIGASADLLFNANAGAAFDKSYANAYALYAGYKITDKLKLNNRFEYATSGYGAFLPRGINAADKVIGDTVTLDYALWANVVTRAEFRWDHAADGRGAFDNGAKNDLSLLANVVYKF
jgi:Putative beta-barrel porin-2, OmpL-like. bbp2